MAFCVVDSSGAFPATVVMPENTSEERHQILRYADRREPFRDLRFKCR